MYVCVRQRERDREWDRELTYQLDRVVRSWDNPNSRDQRHKQHTQLPESLWERERRRVQLDNSISRPIVNNAYLRAMSPDPTWCYLNMEHEKQERARKKERHKHKSITNIHKCAELRAKSTPRKQIDQRDICWYIKLYIFDKSLSLFNYICMYYKSS